MSKKIIMTEEEPIEGMTVQNAHVDELTEISVEEWDTMLRQSEPIVLSESDYNQLVAALEQVTDPSVVEKLKKLLKRKAPWE